LVSEMAFAGVRLT